MKSKVKLKLKWKIIFIILLLLLISFIFLRYIGTSGLIEREYKVANKNLPNSFYGLKIVHFSDLHYGMCVDEKVLKKLVDKINKVNPDIVVFTGDLIDKNTTYTEELDSILTKYLTKINSVYGKYYVTGNHDVYKSSFNSLMSKSGFTSLDNSFEIIENESNNTLFIGGLSVTKVNYSYIKDEFEKNKYDYKILLMHYPDNYDNVSTYNFDLILSGHSHNGQVRLPYIGALVKPENAKKYYNEYYKINNTNFYISGGVGNSVLNLRLFNTPSFNLYRLVDK